jgi:hypothetical protein
MSLRLPRSLFFPAPLRCPPSPQSQLHGHHLLRLCQPSCPLHAFRPRKLRHPCLPRRHRFRLLRHSRPSFAALFCQAADMGVAHAVPAQRAEMAKPDLNPSPSFHFGSSPEIPPAPASFASEERFSCSARKHCRPSAGSGLLSPWGLNPPSLPPCPPLTFPFPASRPSYTDCGGGVAQVMGAGSSASDRAAKG